MWKRKKPRAAVGSRQQQALSARRIEGQIQGVYAEDVERLQKMLGDSVDLTIREFPGCRVLFFRTMVDLARLEESVLSKLGKGVQAEQFASAGVQQVERMEDAMQELLNGCALIFPAGQTYAYAVWAHSREKRAIQEPQSEAVIRGARSGFTEEIDTSLYQVRRRLRTPALRAEEYVIGSVSQTRVFYLYLEGIAEPSLVQEVRNRVSRIELDGVLESNYIEEMIEENPFGLFPTVQNTERPDTVASGLLEGKVALLVDGTPFALVMPMTFWSAMQASEDFYTHYTMATAIRWVRYIFLFIALLFPSIYVAITTFHQEMLPTNLLLSVAAARETSPFPALVEALLMEITFEALREAGVRLPRPIGQAVSIVGALVIGQAAVEAGIISAPMVIVVSITGIASFTIPRYNFGYAMRLLRFPFIILAGSLGLFGIVLSMMALMLHVSSLRSFGVPYMAPVSPFSKQAVKDAFVRAPLWMMNKRPEDLGKENPLRVPKRQKPGPHQQAGPTEEAGDP